LKWRNGILRIPKILHANRTPAVWTTQPPDQWVPGFFLGVKGPETEADYSNFIQRRG